MNITSTKTTFKEVEYAYMEQIEKEKDPTTPFVKYGYARVSCLDQNISTQVEMLIKSGINPLNIFQDISSSYMKIQERPNLDALLKNIAPGDSITVVRLDRLARSTKELLDIIDMMGKKGCHIHSLTENINTEGALGTLYVTMLSAIKEFEREIIRERSKEGIERARIEGKYKGRAKKFTPNQVNLIKKMVQSGAPLSEIARVNKCSRTTIYRYLGMLDKGSNSLAIQKSREARRVDKKTPTT